MSSFQSLVAMSTDIIKDLSGGKIMTDSKYSRRQAEEKIRQARASVIQDYVLKSNFKSIDDNWLQEYTPTYDKTINSNTTGFVDFVVPKILLLPKHIGFFWCGRADSATNNDGYTNIQIIANAGEAAVLGNHRYTRLNNDKFKAALYVNGRVRIFNARNIKKIKIKAVFEDPTDTLLGLDKEDDMYPVSGHMIPIIKNLVKGELEAQFRMNPDYINDGMESANPLAWNRRAKE